jgi:hypothetical protein
MTTLFGDAYEIAHGHDRARLQACAGEAVFVRLSAC